jgi:hypothetical protein
MSSRSKMFTHSVILLVGSGRFGGGKLDRHPEVRVPERPHGDGAAHRVEETQSRAPLERRPCGETLDFLWCRENRLLRRLSFEQKMLGSSSVLVANSVAG